MNNRHSFSCWTPTSLLQCFDAVGSVTYKCRRMPGLPPQLRKAQVAVAVFNSVREASEFQIFHPARVTCCTGGVQCGME